MGREAASDAAARGAYEDLAAALAASEASEEVIAHLLADGLLRPLPAEQASPQVWTRAGTAPAAAVYLSRFAAAPLPR